jgi:hypothetical protein
MLKRKSRIMPNHPETHLHGVISIGKEASFTLKKQALLFDRLVIASPPLFSFDFDAFPLPAYLKVDVEFLKSKGILLDSRDLSLPLCSVTDQNQMDIKQSRRIFKEILEASKKPKDYSRESLKHKLEADLLVRSVAAKINAQKLFDCVPIYRTEMSSTLAKSSPEGVTNTETVLSVAFEELPMPGMGSSWEDILAFREEMQDKKWTFRRFLKELATKNQTEAEIRDDIEWTMNEYRKAMEIHHLKTTHSFVDVFLIAPLGIVEKFAKFEWSELAKTMLSVKTRKVELLEAEMKAPGKECAYLFEAQKRFRAVGGRW